jgi:uncharacterized integral membrane protein
MPWRLIFVVILMGIVIAFIGFNLDNRADVSFGFHEFEAVPIFISLFVAFLAGVIVMLPFTLGFRRRRKEKVKKEKSLAKETPALEDGTKEKGGGFLKRKKNKKSKAGEPAENISQPEI